MGDCKTKMEFLMSSETSSQDQRWGVKQFWHSGRYAKTA